MAKKWEMGKNKGEVSFGKIERDKHDKKEKRIQEVIKEGEKNKLDSDYDMKFQKRMGEMEERWKANGQGGARQREKGERASGKG